MSNIKILSYPAIMESGVYDAVFEVNGEVVEREFEVDIVTSYYYDRGNYYYNLKDLIVSATCCNEEDEDIAVIMEYKLEEEVEWYIRSR